MARLHEIYELRNKNIYAGKGDKTLLYAKFDKKDGNFFYYDGKSDIFSDGGEIFRAGKKGFNKDTREKSKYIIMNECLYCKYGKKSREPHKNIKQCYEHSKMVYDRMHEDSGGKLNMNITGDISTTLMKRLIQKMEYLVDLNKPEIVNTKREYGWLKDATCGPLIYAIPRTCTEPFLGYVQAWDINSCHCSILRKDTFKYPIKCGEYMIIDEIPKKIKFGIYRAIIKFENTHVNNFRFRINEDNKYTHIDMRQARKFGFEINLIKDGNANFLYYSDDKLFSGLSFKGYIDEIYEIKEKTDNKDVKVYYKQLLSSLWGYLTEERYIQTYCKIGEVYDVNLKDDDEINREVFDDKKDKITIFNYSDPYKTRFARLKPFLMAHVRKSLSDIYKNEIDKVVRVHTDGFYIKASRGDENLYIATRDIGGIKLEYEGDVEIKNVNRIKKMDSNKEES
jgi:hypothetical protein